MFNLDAAIATWRQQMAEAGSRAPEVLSELESHLRDDVERQVSAGSATQQVFEAAVERIGQAAALECEFEKLGGTKKTTERVKDCVFTLAGIPNQYLTVPMNTSSTEPRWATYVKAAAFLLPAVFLWAISVVFLIPKLQQICADAGGDALPSVVRGMIFLTRHGVLISCALILLLCLLEWRSSTWARFRRGAVGVGTFVLNGVILISMFMMVVAALLAAPALIHLGQRNTPAQAK